MKVFIKKIVVIKLTYIARIILWRHKPTIIAITGSVGKTSTKDAIYTALKSVGGVRRSEKSFNSELGVPLSIIGAKSGWNNIFSWLGVIAEGIRQIFLPRGKYPSILILEVGADRPGDIRSIAKWLRPHVVVITRLPDIPVHIEFFPTTQSLIDEKLSLARYLRKEGTLVLNADDPRVLEAKEIIRARTITYGVNPIADIRASNVLLLSPNESTAGGLAFKLEFEGKSLPVILPSIYSKSFVSVALAALAVAHVLEQNMITAIGNIAEYEPPPGRVRLIEGNTNSIIIDDTYNSSPAACEAGLTMLADMPMGKRKIAVIGDMLELGKHTIDAHRAIGKIAHASADILVTVGLRAKEIAVGAIDAGMSSKKIIETDDAISAIEQLKKMLHAGDLLYIKGSQGMRMERIVKALMKSPDHARELLVRQESEWTKK